MILVFSVLISTSLQLFNQNLDQKKIFQFQNWSLSHNFEILNSSEFDYRMKLYFETDEKINHHNSLNLSWKLGHNQFSALTIQEIQNGYLMEPQIKIIDAKNLQKQKPISQWNITNQSKDWSELGKTTPVRDQGKCSSCYAFSSVDILSSVDSIIYNPTNQPKILSPQYIIDCGRQFSPNSILGCQGTKDNLEVARFLKKAGTISEQKNPYTGYDQKCKNFDQSEKTFLKKYEVIKGQYENLIKAVERAPVYSTITINFSLLYYKEGIIDIKAPCGLVDDHAVQIIGYDLTVKKPFLKIKNSWGTVWGDKGFAKLAIQLKSKTGMCAILHGKVIAYY